MPIDLYGTVAGVAAYANLTENQAENETLLTKALRSASRAVDIHCGFPARRFWQDSAVQTRTYKCDNAGVAWVDDISTTTGLVVKTDTTGDYSWATTWDTGDYDLEPANADTFVAADLTTPARAWWRVVAIDDKTFPVHTRRKTLQVTARFGWSAVPDEVDTAAMIKAAKLFKRKDSPLGSVGFDQFGVRISRYEDPDIVMLLDPLRRVHMAAV